jgi:hypothetical protein
MVHVADGEVVGQHCPDFAVLRIKEHQQIVLVKKLGWLVSTFLCFI